MSEQKDPYYSHPYVSNSDLSWLKKYWQPENIVYDLEKAYRFGTLIDCMLTEPGKVNYFKHSCAGYVYSKEEFELAEEMKKAFLRDPFCKQLFTYSDCQKISMRENFKISHEGFDFALNVRCKWDFYALSKIGMTGDLKSTTATTQKQFEEACHHFEYFRQRAWYMDIANVKHDVLIGVSKVNQKVFKIPITRDDEKYKTGKAQYQELAFKWWYLFEDLSASSQIVAHYDRELATTIIQ